MDRVPRQIGKYRIVRRLTRGGMGVVYKAVHVRLRKPFALKLVGPDADWMKTHRARFAREMLLTARLEHDGVVRASDADEADGYLYLVTEWVDGADLRRLAALAEAGDLPGHPAGPLAIGVAAAIVASAARTMHDVHETGSVHRDLKPSNVMLARHGGVKICDLGLATMRPELSGQAEQETAFEGDLTRSGAVMGTVDFMAPEQAADPKSVDARADVYALGATLYRLVCGRLPYPTERFGSLYQKLTALAAVTPEPVRSLRPDCPPELAAVIEAAMAKSPDDRIATAAELADRLRPFADPDAVCALAAAIPPEPPDDWPADLSDAEADSHEFGTDETIDRPSFDGHAAPAQSEDRTQWFPVITLSLAAILITTGVMMLFAQAADREPLAADPVATTPASQSPVSQSPVSQSPVSQGQP